MIKLSENNTSGHGPSSTIPIEIKKWNWGAFWLTWIWGICNKSYIALLVFVPVANIIIPFYLGANGNELAWRNRYWDDVDEFKQCQKAWSIAGWIFIGIVIIIMSFKIKNDYNEAKITQEIVSQVIEIIDQNDEVNKLIGANHEVSSSFSNDIGSNIMLVVRGDKGMAFVYVKFNEHNEIQKIVVSPPDNKTKDDEKENIEIRVN